MKKNQISDIKNLEYQKELKFINLSLTNLSEREKEIYKKGSKAIIDYCMKIKKSKD